MSFPPLDPETNDVSTRISELEKAAVTAEDLQARVIALRNKDPESLTDAELIDSVACTTLHRRTTSGPPKAKSKAKKIDADDLLANL